MESAYDPLYDILLQGPPNTGWLAVSAAAVVIALAVLWLRRRQGRSITMPRFFAIGFALMLAVTGLSVWDHYRLQAALREGRALVVEGQLQSYGVENRARYNSSSKRYDRSVSESFYVGDVPFGFIRDSSAAGYTNSGNEPLVFVQGEMLRVHYVEDVAGEFDSRRILRVERLRMSSAKR